MHVLCSTSSLLLRSATLIAGVQGALHCLHHPRASAAVAATCASTARAPSPASRPQSVPAGAAAIPVSISSSDSQYCLHHYPPRQQPRYQHRHDQHRRLRHRCHQCSCRRLCRRHSLLFIFCHLGGSLGPTKRVAQYLFCGRSVSRWVRLNRCTPWGCRLRMVMRASGGGNFGWIHALQFLRALGEHRAWGPQRAARDPTGRV